MKVNCACGEKFKAINKVEYEKPYKVQCPKCKRSYEVWIVLSPEKKEFWE